MDQGQYHDLKAKQKLIDEKLRAYDELSRTSGKLDLACQRLQRASEKDRKILAGNVRIDVGQNQTITIDLEETDMTVGDVCNILHDALALRRTGKRTEREAIQLPVL